MEVVNVLKVIDIDKDSISNACQDLLKNFVSYRDNSLDEDLYSVEDALDDINSDRKNSKFLLINNIEERDVVEKEIRMMQQLANDNDAGYVRLIT